MTIGDTGGRYGQDDSREPLTLRMLSSFDRPSASEAAGVLATGLVGRVGEKDDDVVVIVRHSNPIGPFTSALIDEGLQSMGIPDDAAGVIIARVERDNPRYVQEPITGKYHGRIGVKGSALSVSGRASVLEAALLAGIKARELSGDSLELAQAALGQIQNPSNWTV